ncbi:mycothiol synthase [Motilibacter aurantiacus]|uniref:mycothiol synthase n=1 Tax=Motilibacter aurantiacus TaxID=2714955 RepID=UPI001407B261|nr:mycothiol synthase [Motilibacter aurantiacus]NHC46865.1 mycothiol synthase [Motilibacter aurantiacus]
MSDALRIEIAGRLGKPEVDAVTWLVEAATEADGVRPLSEHVELHLRYGGDRPARSLLAWDGDALAAYAHLDVTDAVAGPSAELVVHPGRRRRGYGRALLDAVLAETPDGSVRVWAHGGLPGAAALARGAGLAQARELLQMRRPLAATLPSPAVPEGVRLRTFRPGEDDASWVELNAAAFAQHPEQGAWTLDDLHVRLHEPWFDPEGFFLAERAGELVGFGWTKVHGGEEKPRLTVVREAGEEGEQELPRKLHGHDPIGELYVLGVCPTARGGGLARVLAVQALAHLRDRGLDEAMLYVDADNTAALRLYESLGFTRFDVDVMYAR